MRKVVVEMETRQCAGCKIVFKVMTSSPQEYHSQFCLETSSGAGKIPMQSWQHGKEEIAINKTKQKPQIEEWNRKIGRARRKNI